VPLLEDPLARVRVHHPQRSEQDREQHYTEDDGILITTDDRCEDKKKVGELRGDIGAIR
jgi:hypothetical protein